MTVSDLNRSEETAVKNNIKNIAFLSFIAIAFMKSLLVKCSVAISAKPSLTMYRRRITQIRGNLTRSVFIDHYRKYHNIP